MSSPDAVISFGEMLDAIIAFEGAAAGRRSATWTRNVRRWRRRMEGAEVNASDIDFALAWAFKFCWQHSELMQREMPRPALIPDSAADVARRAARVDDFVFSRAPYRRTPAFKPLHKRVKLVGRYADRAAEMDDTTRLHFLAARRTGALRMLAKAGIEGKDAGLAADRFTSEVARVAALQRGRAS